MFATDIFARFSQQTVLYHSSDLCTQLRRTRRTQIVFQSLQKTTNATALFTDTFNVMSQRHIIVVKFPLRVALRPVLKNCMMGYSHNNTVWLLKSPRRWIRMKSIIWQSKHKLSRSIQVVTSAQIAEGEYVHLEICGSAHAPKMHRRCHLL